MSILGVGACSAAACRVQRAIDQRLLEAVSIVPLPLDPPLLGEEKERRGAAPFCTPRGYPCFQHPQKVQPLF